MAWSRRLGLATACLIALAGPPLLAHQLVVFAFLEGDVVVVEAGFSNDRPAREGVVRVFDAGDALILELPLGEDGTARFALGEHESGLKVEVSAGEGHSNYWILTPQDIATQRARP